MFKLKHSCDGTVERFKARLVAKGYTWKYGIDYDETFSPVVRFSSIRCLLAFAVQNDLLIHQMDVETAFLNGKLDEEIYMQQPEGYVKPGEEHLVCKLEKSLYGLKQSSRCWNKVFRECIEKIGFIQASADPCVFIRKDALTIIGVHVDDMMILARNITQMRSVKDSLKLQFKMKDMGELHYYVGVCIVQDVKNKQVFLHQGHYVEKMVEKFAQTEEKPVSTPADLNVKLQKEDGFSKPVDVTSYQSIVGSLLYAAIETRPDIALAVGVVSKICANPTQNHLTETKRILRYLKATAYLGLSYTGVTNLIYPFVTQALFFLISIYICILFSFLCCNGFCVCGIKVVNSTKATGVLVPMAMPCVCMKNLSLNLKEFSSSMSRKSSRKSSVGIGALCS